MNITYQELKALLAQDAYQNGVAMSAEDNGTFAGPITSLEFDESTGIKILVSPHLRETEDGWVPDPDRGSTMTRVAPDGMLDLEEDDDRVISFHVQMIGQVFIYPNTHPDTQHILAHKASPAGA